MAKKQAALASYAGIGVIVLGISLGASLVQLNDGKDARVLVAATQGAAQECGQPQFTNEGKNERGLTAAQWASCIKSRCKAGQKLPLCPNTSDSLCKQHCVSSATSQGGTIDCCRLAPNAGCTEVDGKCGGQLPEDQPKEEGMGGMPPMLPMIPMPMPKPDMPMPPPDCEQSRSATASPTPQVRRVTDPCPPKVQSGVSGLFGNIFGGETSVGETVKSSLESAAKKLNSFINGDSASDANTTGATETKNPTVVVTSHTSTVTATPSTDANTTAGASGSAAPTNPVTGFGTQAGGTGNGSVLTNIGQTLSAIGATLKNMLSSLLN